MGAALEGEGVGMWGAHAVGKERGQGREHGEQED